MKTNDYKSGVIGILSIARKNIPEIGSYIEHQINENFEFYVTLSNGLIIMTVEIAHDYIAQPISVTVLH